MYRATKDPFYLYVGEQVLSDLLNYTKVDVCLMSMYLIIECGFAVIRDVLSKEHEDRMESFFLSETLKYLYLLFDEGISDAFKAHSKTMLCIL